MVQKNKLANFHKITTAVHNSKQKAIRDILGGTVNESKNYQTGIIKKINSDDDRYKKALTIKTPKTEELHIVNPITGKSADIVLSRQGTTNEKLAMIMLSPDATHEQKDSMMAQYLFERGKESSSFIAELFISKGTHVKETQAFKRQMRFDFEAFASIVSGLFTDISDDIKRELQNYEDIGHDKVYTPFQLMLVNLGQRLEKGAILIESKRAQLTENRMKEKGYGVYINKHGQAFSIFDDEINDAVEKDKDDINKENATKVESTEN